MNIKTKNERDAHRAALHSAEVIRAMRDWIADCWWPDLDSSEIDELSDEDVIAGVVRHFDGGVSAFLATMEVGA